MTTRIKKKNIKLIYIYIYLNVENILKKKLLNILKYDKKNSKKKIFII